MSGHPRYLLIKYWLSRQFDKHGGIIEPTGQTGGAGAKGGKKWDTLKHNGVLFPPEYISHGIKLIYKGEGIQLAKDAEEYATLYAKYLETEYIKNKTFNKNFWADWRQILGKDHKVQDLDNCSFHLIHNYILEEKEKKKALSENEKKVIKEKKEADEKKYKTAIVDGKEQPVGNFRMEPPGIYIGRGCNPKLGMIKKRIYPEDIIINIGKGEPIPEAPAGHKWGSVIHDREVEWLASWKDDITGKTKYVWLGAHSDMKAQSDMNKFELARKLKKKIKTIKEENDKNLASEDNVIKQTATALYFIDNLALRVGNEKGSDEADTVGVTSLRVEHIKLSPNNEVTLDFLGKDSVRYVNTITVEPQVYKNIDQFMNGKNKSDDLFDKIKANDINKYLQSFMKGLTAKVFRTYNASNLFQKELQKVAKRVEMSEGDDKINILLDEFNKANAKVALLCNHQKNISKSFTTQVDKINENIKRLKGKIKKAKNTESKNKLKEKVKQLKIKKELKIQLKNVSLGTSKTNYLDPRITVAFMKKYNLPVDKVFSKTLQEKFKWAFDVDEEYKF